MFARKNAINTGIAERVAPLSIAATRPNLDSAPLAQTKGAMGQQIQQQATAFARISGTGAILGALLTNSLDATRQMMGLGNVAAQTSRIRPAKLLANVAASTVFAGSATNNIATMPDQLL